MAFFLVHGWGFGSGIWSPVVGRLGNSAQAPNLPGYGGQAAVQSFEKTVDVLLAAAPARACWVGWSLGGLLALAAATRAPARVSRLLLVCCNPCFVARDDWPGMAPEVFGAFESGLEPDPKETLKRFAGLVAQGAADRRSVLRTLRGLQQDTPIDTEALAAGLGWLRDHDLRAALDAVTVPVRALFGTGDALVPASVNERLAGRGVDVLTVEGAGHAPMLSAPEEFAAILEQCGRD